MSIGEQIIIWLLVLPFVALLLVIVESVGEKRRSKRRDQERVKFERVISENRRRLSAHLEKPPSKPVVRGYDSAELFREDALIRIRQLEAGVKPSS